MKRKIYMVSVMLFWGKSKAHCSLFLVVIRILETIQTVSGKWANLHGVSNAVLGQV